MNTEWQVRGRAPVIYVTAECAACKSGVVIERPIMWIPSGEVLDGDPVLKPILNPHARFRHSGCHGRVEEPPRELWTNVFKALNRPDLEKILLA